MKNQVLSKEQKHPGQRRLLLSSPPLRIAIPFSSTQNQVDSQAYSVFIQQGATSLSVKQIASPNSANTRTFHEILGRPSNVYAHWGLNE
jgi:hypothetical protein